MAFHGFEKLRNKMTAHGTVGRKKYGKPKFQRAAAQGKTMEHMMPMKKGMMMEHD